MTADLRDAQWRKSTFSGDTGNCVEVASNLPGIFAVRDSKNHAGLALVIEPGEWLAFVSAVKAGALGA
ncbi:DUF397 domain-containing protein [Sphaerisporangium sp. NPDC088356]|uniref:DUF397 domain-containing protein n=1 Tax=Sphaerisporangium sp. NPDC088356 TaxID=3154871 RepID=UPI0034481717